MKKAKLLLFALASIAAIGASFAFKAKRFTTHYIYTGTLHSGVCMNEVDGAGVVCGGTPNVAASCTPMSSSCPDAYTAALND